MKLLYISGDGWLICNDEDYVDTGGNIEIRNGKYINLLNIPRQAYEEQVAKGGNTEFFLVEHMNDQITTVAMLAAITNNMTDGPISVRRETITKEASPTGAFVSWVLGTSSGIEIAQNLGCLESGKILKF